VRIGAVTDPLAEVARWDAAAGRATSPCGDGRIVWRCWGEGRPLLLLHGGAGSWRHWIRNLPTLTARRRVLAPDLPGLGESDMPPQPWTVASVAAVVADGLDRLIGADAASDVMGFSFGSLVAGHVAARLGTRARTLVLVGASGLGLARGNVVLEKVRDKTGEARIAAHRRNLARLMIADPARIDAQALAIQAWNSDHARLRSVGLSTTTVLLDALGAASARLGAVWGACDAVARDTLAARLATLRRHDPKADLRIVGNAGHWVAYEAADAFNAIAAEMLDPAGRGG
jgi:pimeloyl-ACP methyl ester carboxylesterase